jgi:hypothetical protein
VKLPQCLSTLLSLLSLNFHIVFLPYFLIYYLIILLNCNCLSWNFPLFCPQTLYSFLAVIILPICIRFKYLCCPCILLCTYIILKVESWSETNLEKYYDFPSILCLKALFLDVLVPFYPGKLHLFCTETSGTAWDKNWTGPVLSNLMIKLTPSLFFFDCLRTRKIRSVWSFRKNKIWKHVIRWHPGIMVSADNMFSFETWYQITLISYNYLITCFSL